MKRKKLKLIACTVLAVCSTLLVACQGSEQHTELPPGYSMICNSTQFVPVMPRGTRLYLKEVHEYKGYSSYQDALKRAWEQYNFVSPPPDTIDWQQCNSMVYRKEAAIDSTQATVNSIIKAKTISSPPLEMSFYDKDEVFATIDTAGIATLTAAEARAILKAILLVSTYHQVDLRAIVPKRFWKKPR